MPEAPEPRAEPVGLTMSTEAHKRWGGGVLAKRKGDIPRISSSHIDG